MGKLHKVLCNKVSLPPLERNLDFHLANLLQKLSTSDPHTALHL